MEDALLRLIAGESDEEEARRVEEHLSGCTKCSERRARLSRTGEVLRRGFVPALGPREWEELVSAARRSPRRAAGLLLAAAVLLALLVPASLYATLEPCRGGADFTMDPSPLDADL